MMQHRFDRILKGLLPSKGTVLLAISGGRDSICMAELFLHSELSVRFEIAHCNFSLRGEESDSDENFVRKWCQLNDVVFNNIRFDTNAYASELAVSIEMAARELRYSWFGKLCREKGFSSVAVAHNANDNAETMLLNLLRGTGIKGISGMKQASLLPVAGYENIKLIRPLLTFSRAEIDNYVNANGIEYRDDSTNAETDFRRNKIRHLVFPILEEINPSFIKTFSNETEHFAQVDAISDEYYYTRRNNIINGGSSDGVRINIESLLSYNSWKYLLYRLLDEFNFGKDTVEALAGIISKGGTVSGKVFISERYRIVTTSSEIIIAGISAVPEKTAAINHSSTLLNQYSSIREGDECMVVEGPGIYEFKGRRILVERLGWNAADSPVMPSGVLAWDADKMPLPLLIRGWKDGDWMQPLGLSGRKKLSDLFTDLKYSLIDKENAIVAGYSYSKTKAGEQSGSRVSALLFKRIDDSIKISETTKVIYRISSII